MNLWGIEKIRGAFTFGASGFGACVDTCVEDTGSILYLLYINPVFFTISEGGRALALTLGAIATTGIGC